MTVLVLPQMHDDVDGLNVCASPLLPPASTLPRQLCSCITRSYYFYWDPYSVNCTNVLMSVLNLVI